MSVCADRWSLIACMLIAGACRVSAEDPMLVDLAAAAPKPEAFYVAFWENDSTPLKPNDNTDRWYTNGLAISGAQRVTGEDPWGYVIPFAPGAGRPDATACGWTFGQLMFSPENLSVAAVIPDDRPYAGYMYLGGFWQRQYGDVMDHIQLDLGVIGTASGAEWLQINLHDAVDTVDPLGWDNQLADEVTIQFYVRRKWRWHLVQDVDVLGSPWSCQLVPQAGFALGTVRRHLEGDLTLRFGHALPDDFGPTRLADLGSATGRGSTAPLSGYGYVRVGGRVVEHDVFVDGSDFKDGHSVEGRNAVGELQLGFMIEGREDDFRWSVGYAQTFQSKSFAKQDDHHAFAGLTIGCSWWF